jgi:hypothetical protein
MKDFAFTEGLRNISSLPIRNEDYFTFIFGKTKIFTSKFVAAFISPKISKLLKEDPFFEEFTIESDYTDIVLFQMLIGGENIKIKKGNSQFLKDVAVSLCNSELLKAANEVLYDEVDVEITTKNVLEEISENYNTGIDISSLASFAAKHISQINRISILGLDALILDQILSDNNLMIENEDWLYELIDEYVTMHGKSSSFLFKNVAFEYLSCGSMHQFIRNFSFDDMCAPLWGAICNRLQHEVVQSTVYADRYFRDMKKTEEGIPIDDPNITRVEFDEAPFKGILYRLGQEASANPHDAGLVEITASSRERSYPKKIVDYDWNNWFFTNNEVNSWIQIDFKDKLISPSHYCIKSDGNHCSHLRCWVLEGTNDITTWKELDRRENQEVLNQDFAVGIFNCKKTRFYRYIRIRQIAENTSGNFYLGICNFEVYGDIKPR